MKLTDMRMGDNFQEHVIGVTVEFPCTIHTVSFNTFRNGSVAWHWHDEVELVLVRQGEIEIELPHQMIHLEEGDGLFIAPEQLHAYRPLSQDASIDACLFDPFLIAGHRNSYFDRAFLAPVRRTPELQSYVFRHNRAEHRTILRLFSEAVEVEASGALAWELELTAYLSRIWVQLLRLAGPDRMDRSNASDLNDRRAKDMLLFLHQHYGEKLEMEQVAAAAHIGVREAFRVFRSTLGISPVQYLTNYRLYHAVEQLTRSDASVTEISEQCGFSTPSYFAKVFRDKLGCTPKEYRREFRKKLNP